MKLKFKGLGEIFILKVLCQTEELGCKMITLDDYGLIHLHIFRIHIGFYESRSL